MTTSDKIKVLVVQPEADVRDYLSHHLRLCSDLVVIGQVDCGEAALDICEHQVVDVVIMDVVLPGLDGLTVTQLLRARFPGIRVLIFTDVNESELIAVALRAGVSGYLHRGIGDQMLIEAVRATGRGLCILTEQNISHLLHRQTDKACQTPDGDPAITWVTGEIPDYELDLYCSLTHRERQILRFVLLGYTSAEIGQKLYISPRTVEKHRANMMNKLGVRNQHELARMAYRMGVMPLEDPELYPTIAPVEPTLAASHGPEQHTESRQLTISA